MWKVSSRILSTLTAFKVLFVLTALISINFAENALIDTVIADIERQPNHVEQLQQITAAYLNNQTDILEKPAISLLSGAKGLAHTPEHASKLSTEYQTQQASWALELVLRCTTRNVSALRANNNAFLTRAAESLIGTDASSLDIEHIAYLVVLSLAFQWDVDHQLYTTPLHAETQLEFLGAEHSYAALATHSPALQQRVYAKVQEKLTSQAKLDAFLKKSGYAAHAPKVLHFLIINPVYTFPKPSGYQCATYPDYALPINIAIDLPSTNPELQHTRLQITGVIKGTQGDGSCYYHSWADYVNNRNAIDSGKWPAKHTRNFLAEIIQANLTDPIVRYWLSENAVKHISTYISSQRKLFPWLQANTIGNAYHALMHRKYATLDVRNDFENRLILEASTLTAPQKRELENQIDQTRQEIDTIKGQLSEAERNLKEWFYTPEGSHACLTNIIRGTDWAIGANPFIEMFSYLLQCEAYIFGDLYDPNLRFENKYRLGPFNTHTPFGQIGNFQHDIWIKDLQLQLLSI
jgi:hypothetical protein